jgi:hypothetical protein
MNKIMLFRPGWWVLHVAAIIFVFWLGHAVRF